MPRLPSMAPLFASALLAACGGAEQLQPSYLFAHAPKGQGISVEGMSTNGLSTNGMSTNGMSTNGMSTNGLSTNGLALNGLNVAGLSTSTFQAWFAIDPDYSSMVMKYIVKCSLPADASLQYTYNNTTYSWPGELGLAPGWATGGNTNNPTEQQLVSACYGAHVNKYGVHVAISVRGVMESGAPISTTADELATFHNDEGCFFGNIFDGTGIFSAYSVYSPLASSGHTSLRACVASNGYFGDCSPMQDSPNPVQTICSGASTTNAFGYKFCSLGGVTYRPVCTRLQDSDIATCGDGICAASESCSTCAADCGACR